MAGWDSDAAANMPQLTVTDRNPLCELPMF